MGGWVRWNGLQVGELGKQHIALFNNARGFQIFRFPVLEFFLVPDALFIDSSTAINTREVGATWHSHDIECPIAAITRPCAPKLRALLLEVKAHQTAIFA